jgi:glycosyltransferase involved in cell wall biosynthesis
MIVKNEAAVIMRCLDSCLPLLDYVLIVDTGSSDGTQQLIRQFLQETGLPGSVVDEPWQDFAHNRSSALQKLRQRPELDYSLMIDADEVLHYEADFDAALFKQQLDQDVYDIETRYGNINYLRPQLCSNHLPFYYKGILHEYLELNQSFTREPLKGLYNTPLPDGARSRNPQKYQEDAAALEAALEHETDKQLQRRYTFYLAQSYRDCKEFDKALNAYARRTHQGGWDEEIYYSFLSIARIQEYLGYSKEYVLNNYFEAHEIKPSRLEALHGAVSYCRKNQKMGLAYLISKGALEQKAPPDALFSEQWIYDYGILDEYTIAAYWAGHYAESYKACMQLLKSPLVPVRERNRIQTNAKSALKKIDDNALVQQW